MSHSTYRPPAEPALGGLFASLGQVLLLLDSDFRIVHAAGTLAGGGADGQGTEPRPLAGAPARELLGEGLFGDRGTLRAALEAGERRDGWRTSLRLGDCPPLLVTLTAAPLAPGATPDPSAAFALVLRPVGSEAPVALTGPHLYCGMAARSAAMLQLFQRIEDLRDSAATVLITGESGTGKELVARALHQRSGRRRGPFVAVHCAGLPETLIESELFGHVRGAFTGAVQERMGRFEAAHGGTLLLDEVGELPLHVQVKLLRVLQQRTVERIGENRPRPFDARIVAATHVDLRAAVRDGRFREDLYYRLRVVTCHLPPLRDRPEDVEALVGFFLARLAEREGRRRTLSPETLGVLLRYSWPGNVRELENALEHGLAVGHGPAIEPEDLPPEVLFEVSEAELTGAGPAGAASEVAASADRPDRDELRSALETHRWRRRETARALGISRTSLWRRMKEHGM